ncbi:MAG: hypothetical protein HYX46_00010 [Betaproteobacteria bacterium]|nr:hypothetical protein [Betaproteobacteria bacterium]
MHLNTTTLAEPHQPAKRTLVLFAIAVFAQAFTPATYADERKSGPNGGQVKDAGKYHLELVVKENALTVYVTGAKDAKVATKGASGSATVLAGKGTSNVKLEPSGENAFVGSGSFQLTPDMKIVVSVTMPGQSPLQARFTSLDTQKPSAKAGAK